ncbi:hypothetical protein FPV67DRAFT_1786387 [Lyophyllum atratum]|nr:hypothetical protein FPV67DRAFT_1786387 [Lyophyllum atratum]
MIRRLSCTPPVNTAMTPRIPEDIIDEIVDVLSTTDLQSYTLVSRVFRVLCQRRLFHSVHLDTRHCERNERLHLTLLGNPVLASFTRSLTIHIAATSRGSPLKAVCGILHMVQSHVRKLSVDGDFDHGTEPWKSFHESLQTALLSIIAHPSCVDVDLGYVGLPITNLSESSHLRHLTLASRESVTIPGDILGEGFSHPGHGEPKIQGYLESLIVKPRGAAERILQTLHDPRRPCPLSLSHLKVFKLCFLDPCCPLIQAILDLAADYLQEITIYTLRASMGHCEHGVAEI